MHQRSVQLALLGCAGLLPAGCSATGAAMTAGRIGLNLMKKDSHLRIWLDGQPARQSKLRKAATGYSRWKVAAPVSTSPRLQFEIRDPDRFGRIAAVSLQIHQKFEADYSHLAEFTVLASGKDPQRQIRPGREYHLGNPPPGLKVLDVRGDEVAGVRLKPGMKYMLVLTVVADRSETAQVFFETS